MLYFTYLRLELRHRLRQAVFIAAGLAVGVALVITVSAVAAGTSNAQAGVLHGLYGIGTDLTVTRPYVPGDTGPGHEVHPDEHLDFLDTNRGLFSASAQETIAGLTGVRSATGVLELTQTLTPANGKVARTPSNPYGLAPNFTVDGVDPASSQLGPLSQAHVISGRGLTASDASSAVALVDSGFARARHLHVGSVLTMASHRLLVVGIVSQPTGSAADILIPLRVAQALSKFGDEITTLDVAVASTADLGAVSAKIKRQLPWADVTTQATLGSEVSGSLGETARLAKDLGRWLAIAVLAAAFLLAGLLTVASVSRRVREFGTLKALGWSTGRITGQVLGESVTIGIAGALVGTGLGYTLAAVISRLARNLTAIVAAAPGHTEPRGFVSGTNVRTGQHFYHPLAFPGTYNSLPVHFSAPVAFSVVALAVGLGVAGGLLAGALGSWRAARLRPTVALAHAG
jgi:putative ABC transport system permease protein